MTFTGQDYSQQWNWQISAVILQMVMYTPENWRMISCTVQSVSRSLCFLIESNNLLLFILSSEDVITLFLLRYVMFFQSRRNSCLKKPIAPTWPWRDPGKTVGRRGQVHQGNYEMYAKEKRQTEPILQSLTIKNTAGKISPEYFTKVLSTVTWTDRILLLFHRLV